MKKIVLFIVTLFCFAFLNCEDSTGLKTIESDVRYTEYAGYSYKGKEFTSNTTLFHCTKTKEDFDLFFYFISDHNQSVEIPSEDFTAKKVVSIVKYGNDFYELKIENISILNEALIVNYKATIKEENMSWVAATPLLVTVSENFKRVIFLENGEKIKEISL